MTSTTRILFISGSLGLGHIFRDLAIVDALRRKIGDINISWLAAHPATLVLEERGERVLREAGEYANDNVSAEAAGEEGFRLNLLSYLLNAMDEWKQNVAVFERAMKVENFDLVIADEAYEIAVAQTNGDLRLEVPFVFIFDFIGNVAMNWKPVEQLVTYMWNRQWARLPPLFAREQNAALFVGEEADIPDDRLGPFLPRRRKLGREMCSFLGYILPFDPNDYTDRAEIRRKLAYGDRPLIICSIGGTSVGRELLEFCGKAYPIIQQAIPEVQMVMVCGPRLPVETVRVPDGVDIRGYVPDLYEHFAASDLTIVQGGGTTTLELTALRRPFIYFPLEQHFEQQVHVAGRLLRHQAGIKMLYSQSTPESLAEAVIRHIGKEVVYPPIPIDGAQEAAAIISPLLQPAA